MTRYSLRHLAELLMAMLGIWLVASRLPDYAAALYMVASTPGMSHGSGIGSGPDMMVLQSVHVAVNVLLGVMLLLARKRLAGWLTSSALEEPSGETLSGGSLLSVGTGLIGIHHLVEGVISLTRYYVSMRPSESVDPALLWQSGVSIVIGLGLFAASIGIGRLWNWLRGRGSP